MRDVKPCHITIRLILGALLLLGGMLPAQQAVNVDLSSKTRSIQVGRPFDVELRVSHPEDVVVIFPDSSSDFAPYELRGHSAIPTRTSAGTSVDIGTYSVMTWEIDSIQELALPVRYLDEGDTVLVMSNALSFAFNPTVEQLTDSMQVLIHKDPLPIDEPIQWLPWMILLGILLVIAAVLVVVFRRPILLAIRRWRIEKDWKSYLARFQKLQANRSDVPTYLSQLGGIWKEYLDKRSKIGLPALTSQELEAALKADFAFLTERDKAALVALNQSADQVLYAGRMPEGLDLNRLTEEVHTVMVKTYRQRRKEAEA